MNDIEKDLPQEEELNKAVEEDIVNEIEKVDKEVKAGTQGQSTKSKGRSQTNELSTQPPKYLIKPDYNHKDGAFALPEAVKKPRGRRVSVSSLSHCKPLE